MNIDLMIILLIIAIAVVAALILLKGGGQKKIYDPHHVDLGNAYDPQHDHFSKEHVQKLKELEMKKKQAQHVEIVTPTAKPKPQPEPKPQPKPDELHHSQPDITVETKKEESDDVQPEGERYLLGGNRRAEDRRANKDRRT